MLNSNILTITYLAEQQRLRREDEVIERMIEYEAVSSFMKLTEKGKRDFILNKICEAFDVTPIKLIMVTRSNHWVFVKAIYYYTAAMQTDLTYETIGEAIGARPSAVGYGNKMIREHLKHPNGDKALANHWGIWQESAPHWLLTKRKP